MRIDRRKKIRDVAGEHIVIMQDGTLADMTKVVALNETALWLYNELREREFSVDDVAAKLTERYDVDADTTMHDATEWVKSMTKEGLIVNG